MIRRWWARRKRAKDKARELKWAAWVALGENPWNYMRYQQNKNYRWIRGW